MRSKFLAGAAAIAMLAMPAALIAQTTDDKPPEPSGSHPQAYNMSAEQQAMYNSWTPERRTDYDAWSDDYKAYYWTLEPQQQAGYWALTPDQRGMIYKMTPDQRAKTWQSVAAQMNGQTPPTPPDQANPPGEGMPTTGVPDPQTASQPVPPAMPADPNYQGGPYKGALTPPPATAMDKTYPVCSKKVSDNCRNRGGK